MTLTATGQSGGQTGALIEPLHFDKANELTQVEDGQGNVYISCTYDAAGNELTYSKTSF